jgi:uncharacterized protein YjbI with pentapeptide repeats
MKRFIILCLLIFQAHLLAVSAEIQVNQLFVETYGTCDDCYLAGVDFTNINPQQVITSLKRAFLVGANFEGLSLRNIDLSGANLQNANFKNADLSGAVLLDANTEGADFSGAIFSAARV